MGGDPGDIGCCLIVGIVNVELMTSSLQECVFQHFTHHCGNIQISLWPIASGSLTFECDKAEEHSCSFYSLAGPQGGGWGWIGVLAHLNNVLVCGFEKKSVFCTATRDLFPNSMKKLSNFSPSPSELPPLTLHSVWTVYRSELIRIPLQEQSAEGCSLFLFPVLIWK